MLNGSHYKQLFKGVLIQTYWHNKLKEISQKIMDTKTIQIPDSRPSGQPDRFLHHDAWMIRWEFDVSFVNVNFYVIYTANWHSWLLQYCISKVIGLHHKWVKYFALLPCLTRWTLVTCAWTHDALSTKCFSVN